MPSNIDHPVHYNAHPTGVECIKIIQYFPFNVGTAMKHLWRAGLKSPNPIEDLEKAIAYIQFEIAKLKADRDGAS